MKVSRKKALQSLVAGFVAVPSLSQANTNVDLSKYKGSFSAQILDPKDNSVLKEMKINGGSELKINKVGNGDEVIILKKL